MKVLLINAVCDSGSTGKICTDIADELIQCGHEVRIIYGNGTSTYPKAFRVGSDLLVKINALYARFSGYIAHGAYYETSQIIKVIESFQPDVLHLHNLHANFVNLKKLLDYLAEHDIATVITLHDCWFFTGKCTHYHSIGCTKWKEGCRDCVKLKEDIPSFIFDKTNYMWNEKKEGFAHIKRLGVIGVSDWITGEAEMSFLANASILRRIYNWIDLKTFVPMKFNKSVDEKFIAFCASTLWEKNTDRFRDLKKLAENLDPSMELIVAGKVEIPEQLPSNVKCIGYVNSQKEMALLYANADVYIHLSREDTFGKVIAEAMACGTPAIVYNSTACPEIVKDDMGYVVSTGDIKDIVKCCRIIQHNGKEVYSKHCRESARDRFNQEKLITETVELYEQLIKMET